MTDNGNQKDIRALTEDLRNLAAKEAIARMRRACHSCLLRDAFREPTLRRLARVRLLCV